MVLTDVMKRWQQLKGRRALLCTGTDEHGMKVQQAAAQAGMEPRPFCDKGAEVFKSLAKKADVSYDHFVRTTDADHREAVEYIWSLLQARGYIYTAKHEGWYSVSDETFYPQSAVHLVLEPRTGRKMMASIETGKEVEWMSELNYHFRLSAFKDRLLEFYKENPAFIVPATRMNDVVRAVSVGLEDLSVSRPVERLSWGIRVPGDDTQTIYVWLDALINYITKAGYPWAPGKENAQGWPAEVHVIGKDIVRYVMFPTIRTSDMSSFHAIYWPAFLLALDLPPPRQLLTHAHWTLGQQKMAKSTGNVVNPFFALDRFEPDIMRYYLAHDGGLADDADYANGFIIERYKKGLQGGLGNLASRLVRGKGWSVRAAVEAAPGAEGDDGPSARQRQHLSGLSSAVDASFGALNPGAALKLIMEAIYESNRYFHASQPWSHVGAPDYATSPASQAVVARALYLTAEALRISGILLQPYMPGKAALLLDMLGVDAGRRMFADARVGVDGGYGKAKTELGRGTEGTLFPPLRSDF
ncbi:MAG: methionyl-tRNA synthetase [Thelocarpon impressellum]|nr:MAG: methionyl-tRNA synthetase [Thelocarpon impressellum]